MERFILDSRANEIVSEWSGIFAPYEAFYIHSILYSADRVLEAFERYESLRSKAASGPDQVSAIHEALGHAASLSRYFWPSESGRKETPHKRRFPMLARTSFARRSSFLTHRRSRIARYAMRWSTSTNDWMRTS